MSPHLSVNNFSFLLLMTLIVWRKVLFNSKRAQGKYNETKTLLEKGVEKSLKRQKNARKIKRGDSLLTVQFYNINLDYILILSNIHMEKNAYHNDFKIYIIQIYQIIYHFLLNYYELWFKGKNKISKAKDKTG